MAILKTVTIVIALVLAAALGGVFGVWYSAQRDHDLAARLSLLPLVGGLFESAQPPADDEEGADPTELKEALLELRGRELDAARAELEQERSELAALAKAVADEQDRLDGLSRELDERELELDGRAQEIDRLASVYGQMKPAAVAKVLGEMDDGLAVAILARLDERQAARILEELEPEQVVRYALRSDDGRAAEGR